MATRTLLLTIALILLLMPGGAAWRTRAVQVPPEAPSRLDVVEQRERKCCDGIAIDPGGRLLATKQYGEVTLWDLETGLELRTLVPRARAIARRPAEAIASVATDSYSGLAFDSSGRYVALTASDNLNPRTFNRARLLAIPHVWEVETGRDVSDVDWTYDPVTQRTGSPRFPFDPGETIFWQVTSDSAVASNLARYRGPASTFSPDGRLGVAFAAQGGPDYAYRLSVIDLDSNRVLWERRVPGGEPPTAHFSPDGRRVVILALNDAWVLDARTGAQVSGIGGSNGVGRAAFSRDSRRLATVRKNQVQVLDASDWRVTADMRAPDDERLTVVTFTHDGRRVIAASGQTVYVWDATSGQGVRQISMAGGRPMQSVAISPRGRWLAAGSASTLPGLSTRISEWPSTVALWPLAGDGSPRRLWSDDADLSILAVAFSPAEERIARVSFSEFVSRSGPQFWGNVSITTLPDSASQTPLNGGEPTPSDLAQGEGAKDVIFTRDGSTIVVGGLGLRGDPPDDPVEFSPYPQLTSYDTRALTPRRVVDLDGRDFTALAASRDGTLLAAGNDANVVRLWTSATMQQRGIYRWPVIVRRDVVGSALNGGSITSLAFHPDGRRLAVARNDGVALLDLERGTRRDITTSKDRDYSAVAFSPEGSSLVVASGIVQGRRFVDARIEQWVTATMRPGWAMDLGATDLPRVVFAPGGKWFAVASSGGVLIHDANTGAHLATLAILATNDWLMWTPDGRYAGTPDGVARLAAIRRGRQALPIASAGRRMDVQELIKQLLR